MICAAWYSCGAAAWGWVNNVIGRMASPASCADAAKPDSTVMAPNRNSRRIVSPLVVMLQCIQRDPAQAFKGVTHCHCEERSDAAISIPSAHRDGDCFVAALLAMTGENSSMPITDAERRFIDEVSLDLPWGLVEEFATMPRWQPEDVNRGADVLVSRLRDDRRPAGGA